jgi:hypothetical protein
MLRSISQRLAAIGSPGKLNVLDQMCLDSWRRTLPPDMDALLAHQLTHVRLIQHQAGGGKVCFYYRDDDEKLFPNRRPDLHVATVTLGVRGSTELGAKMRVRVFVHRGRLFSLEYPKRPDRYLEQHHISPSLLTAVGVETHVALHD